MVQSLQDLQFGDIIAGNSVSTAVVDPFTDARSIQSGDATAFGGTVTGFCASAALL